MDSLTFTSKTWLTETWLIEKHNNVTAVIKSYGYNLIHEPRTDETKTRGGGVAIVSHKSLNLTPIHTIRAETFESVSAKFRDDNGENICCTCIYRTGVINDLFYSEFDDFLGNLFIKYTRFIICGDINIHLDNKFDTNSEKFLRLISSYGLHQLVDEPTHKSGHTLDVAIASHGVIRDSSIEVMIADSASFSTCDHFIVCYELKNCDNIQSKSKKTITFRNTEAINRDDFRSDLTAKLPAAISSEANFAKKIKGYNSTSLEILDDHAPVLSKDIVDRKSAPWFDGEYKSLRAMRRQAERAWKTSSAETSQLKHQIFLEIRDKCSALAEKKKHAYFKNQFSKHNHSSKSLYKFVDNILDKEKSLSLPPTDDLKECVDKFNSFFQEKVDNIRKKFSITAELTNEETNKPSTFSGNKLENFRETDIEEIDHILSSTEFKASTVDPIPSHLIKENKDLFLPVLCDIVNASLSSGNVDGTKLAHITPLLKGTGLDTSI